MEPNAKCLTEKFEAGLFLSDVEVAALLSVCVKTLRNWRATGRGPRFVKIGDRCVRYKPADVKDFVARGDGAGQQQVRSP
ncbi:MAG TPA: helix-turn-helix domain-containing protein [Gammaproteobacteria bacterium]|nr:helix-turn-helix domain-containing protein [Gammaproteobacteria bacterium]